MNKPRSEALRAQCANDDAFFKASTHSGYIRICLKDEILEFGEYSHTVDICIVLQYINPLSFVIFRSHMKTFHFVPMIIISGYVARFYRSANEDCNTSYRWTRIC